MIHPDVCIHSLDRRGTAHLQRLFGKRQMSGRQIHILHSAGIVVSQIDTLKGPVDVVATGDPMDSSAAERILETTGVQRVVIVDQELLRDYSGEFADVARKSPLQADLLWRGNDMFWSHPGVVTHPALPRNPWPAVGERLKSFGQSFAGVLALYDEGIPFSDFAFIVEGGLVVEIYSVGGWTQHTELLERVETRTPVALVIGCEVNLMDRLFEAEDPLAALKRAEDELTFQKGLRELLDQ